METWNRNSALAAFVRKRRKEAGYTQIELADLTGIGLRFLRELEQGKPNLMMDKVNLILKFFGHTLEPKPLTNETGSHLD